MLQALLKNSFLLPFHEVWSMSHNVRMFWSYCTFFSIALCCVHVQPLVGTPHFSSKAIRIASQARTIIAAPHNVSSHKELEQAAESIEVLFSDASFRRLDTKDQVDIILLLSKAYEKLESWDRQEKMLASYAKKREFHRYYIQLQTELARSYVIQDRFEDADKILSKVIGKSCATLPQDEKRRIAAVVLMKDAKLNRMLQQADRLRLEGSYTSSALLYRVILDSVTRKCYPYQASRIEKKRLKYKIMLQLSETYLLSGDYENALELLASDEKWKLDIFNEQDSYAIQTTRMLLKGLGYLGIGEIQKAKDILQESLSSVEQAKSTVEYDDFSTLRFLLRSSFFSEPHENTPVASPLLSQKRDTTPTSPLSISPKMYLWLSLCTISHKKPLLHPYQVSASVLDKQYLKTCIETVQYAQKGQFGNARDEARRALQQLQQIPIQAISPFQKEIKSFHKNIIIDFLWNEATLYAILGKYAAAQRIIHKILELSFEEPSERARERFVFWMNHIEPFLSKTISSEDHAEKQISKNSEKILELITAFENTHTDFFPSTLRLRTSTLQTLLSAQSCLLHNTDSKPFHNQEKHVTLDRPISLESLYQSLFSLIEALEDLEGRSFLAHVASDLMIMNGNYYDAFSLFSHVLSCTPIYPKASQLAFHLLTSTKDQHEVFQRERENTFLFIFSREPTDIFPYLSILSDDHALLYALQKLSKTQPSSPLVTFTYAVSRWKEAKKIFNEAEKTKEPGLMKEKYETAFSLYSQASESLVSLLEDKKAPSSPSSYLNPPYLSFEHILLSLNKEWLSKVIQTFHRHDAIYNELIASLEHAHNFTSFQHKLLSVENFQKDITLLQEIASLQASVPIYTAAFTRNFNSAIQTATSFKQKSDPSPQRAKAVLFLCQLLRENGILEEEEPLLLSLNETLLYKEDHELALHIAFEKALFFREVQDYDHAMSYLAWITNDPYASSLRVRAMLIRAEIYSEINRDDLAIRQFEAVATKGGEWAKAAERKLEELKWR